MKKVFEARTEQEAIDLAVREFGVNADYLEVEILQKSKNGFFGRGGKVQISASVLGLPQSEDHYQERTQHEPHSEYQEQAKEEASQEHQDTICNIVKELVAKLGIEVECSFSLEDNYYMVTIDTMHEEDQNILIGKHGKNIEALQNICNSIIHNSLKEFNDYIVIEVAQYRKKRSDWLNSIARKKAEQVIDSGKPQMLDELGPFDRKLVHATIRDYHGVSTLSKGDGYYKRIKLYLDD